MLDTQGDLRTRIRQALARFVQIDANEIDESRDFVEYGLGSAEAALFIGAVEESLGYEIPAQLVYECPSVAQLSQAIAALHSQAAE